MKVNLISGGAFQYDEDGNGYTENYFEGETQVGWYTRADGKKKPVYRESRILSVVIAPAATGTWVTLYTADTGRQILRASMVPVDNQQECNDWRISYGSATGIVQVLPMFAYGGTCPGEMVSMTYLKSTDAWV
jgi:hypothetical protein